MTIGPDRMPIDAEPYLTADFSAKSLQRIDAVCVQFEKEWRAGGAPTIESCLDGFEDELRTALFTELLFLDIEYRTGAGQTPSPADYETRFPGDTPVIESAFKCVGELDPIGARLDKLNRTPPFKELSLTSRFQFRQFHAQGGLGVVYIACDDTLKRNVAVKFSRNRLRDSADQRRLAREAEITGRLEHPGIVPVYATGFTDNGFPCYIMQLIEGQSMHDAICELHDSVAQKPGGNPFYTRSFRRLLQSFISVCNTIAYAHDQRVIHRDVKPGNIMLGRFGETFLLDWGLAKLVVGDDEKSAQIEHQQEELIDEPVSAKPNTRPGQRLGTPAYASPEQASGNTTAHTERSDIYSLGATLYCLLVGKGPVDSREMTSVDSVEKLKSIPRPRELNGKVPRELDAICLKATAFDSQDRYASAEQLAQDLERYLADEPIDVLTDSWIRKVGRWGRKHPRMVSAVATTVLVATVSLAVGSYVLGHNYRLLAKTNSNLRIAEQAQRMAQTETMSTLRTLTDEVVQQWLAKKEELSQEDHDFVESILARYQAFADSRPDQTGALDTRAEGYFRVGQLQQLLDNKEDAIDAWEAGLELLPNGPSVDSSNTLRNLYSKMQSALGVAVAQQGDRSRGEELIKKAVASQFKLLEQEPDNAEYRQEYAQRLDQLGNVYVQGGEFGKAVSQFRKSLKLLAEDPGVVPSDALWLCKLQAGTYHNLGLSLSNLGEYDAAAKQLEYSRQLHRELVEQSSRINYRVDLGRVLSTLGGAYRSLRRFELAESSFADSIGILTEIESMYPSLAEPASLIAAAHHGLAGVHYDLRDYEKALAECETALTFNEKALDMSPAEVRYRRTDSEINAMMGAVCERLNRPGDAEKHYSNSLAQARELFDGDNQFPHRQQLVRLLKALGNLKFQQHDFKATKEFLGQAIGLIDELKDSPDRQRIVFDEVGCHQIFGWSLMFSGQLEAAAGHWQSVIDATELHPIVLQGEDMGQSARAFRALCIARTKPSESVDIVEMLAKNSALVPSQIYNLSCAAAMASQYLDSEADVRSAEQKALALLERSVKAGMFADRGALQRLKGNPSFKTLFDHDEFKRIETLIASSLDEEGE